MTEFALKVACPTQIWVDMGCKCLSRAKNWRFETARKKVACPAKISAPWEWPVAFAKKNLKTYTNVKRSMIVQ